MPSSAVITRVIAIVSARNKEFYRDRAALFWNIAMPFLIVIGFAFALSGGPKDVYKVGIHGDLAHPELDFLQLDYIDFIPVTDLPTSIAKVERHRLDMLIDLDRAIPRYWINTSSPKGYFLGKLIEADPTNPSQPLEAMPVSGKAVAYVDWLIPGMLGMNMMFSCLYGVGYIIVRYRKNGVLRRLKATPLTAVEFLFAQILSRFIVVMTVTALVYLGIFAFVDFHMHGSHWVLAAVFALGAFCMIALGLIISARLRTEEVADGFLNLLAWAMMFLSGVWFSLEGTNDIVQYVALLLPLTHIVDAARTVMLDGAGWLNIAPQLITLAAMTFLFLAIAALLFHWD